MFESDSANRSHSVVIVGGGVIGLSIAWELATRGHQVTLLDRQPANQSTSWAAAGILPPNHLATATDPLDQLRGYSHSLFEDWTTRLHQTTGIDPEYRCCGGWYLSSTAGEAAAMAGMLQYWQDLGIPCESVTANELGQREPALLAFSRQAGWDDSANGFKRAWFTPTEHQIRPPALLRSLHAACEQAGVTFQLESEVTQIQTRSGAPVCLTSNGNRVSGDHIVLAGGSYTGLIEDSLLLGQSLVPIRGQVLLFKTEQPLLRSVVNVGHRYVLCREDGDTLVGSCEEEVGFNPGTTKATLDMLRQFAIDLIPSLAQAEMVDSWAGLRPLTFDGFPMIGPVPDRPRVHVASGHFRSGIHLAFGTARLMADELEGRQPELDLSPFRVGKQQTHSIS